MPSTDKLEPAEGARAPRFTPDVSNSLGQTLWPPLTPGGKKVLWIMAGLFILFVALRLNGSSIACLRLNHWNDLIVRDAPSGLLLSTPKIIRSDEWMVWTPAIVSQARQSPSFPTNNPSLGPGKTPLLMSIPARDYTMFLRPQLWGYFFLPVDFGFAWNWDFKIFGLLAAMFLFFWRITGGKFGVSLFGALCVFFSPFVQWWFSSPSMLPEMLTYWALGVGSALQLFTPRSRQPNLPPSSAWLNAAGVVVLAVSLANLMLCCYPPFEIVLFHLGLFIVAGYVWQHRLPRLRGVLLAAAAGVLAALLLLPWFLECYDTLQIVAHTVYPGQRQCFGGGLSVVRLFAGFFSPALTERNTPAALFNVCEASSFYPLWLLPLGLGLCAFAGVLWRAPSSVWQWLRARGLKVMLAVYLVIFTLFALVRFPAWLCHATLLSRILEVRGLAGMGLASTILVVLALSAAPGARASWKLALPVGIAWSLGVFAFFLWQQPTLLAPPASTPFLTTARLLELEGAAVVFGFVYLLAPSRWVQVTLLAPFILWTALINPVGVGLPELLGSPVINEVRATVQKDPAAQWAFYHSLAGVEVLKATGAALIDGVRIIPDFALIRTLDPRGQSTSVYNRYSHLIFDHAHLTPEVSVSLERKVFCVVEISVPEILARFPRVKYIAACCDSPDVAAGGFRLWKRWPEEHLWIYRLADQPNAPNPAKE